MVAPYITQRPYFLFANGEDSLLPSSAFALLLIMLVHICVALYAGDLSDMSQRVARKEQKV